MTETLEPLDALLLRYQAEDELIRGVPRASLAEALRGGNDPLRVIEYFGNLGLPIECLDDLLRINDDPDEEEIHAFKVVEGVAVSLASDGVWALYTP
jgi:hypothetical protein